MLYFLGRTRPTKNKRNLYDRTDMKYLLLAVIYLTFVSLGLPDSVFGASWPIIQTDFATPGSLGSIYTMITGFAGALAGFFAGRLIARFGTYAVTAASVALTAAGLIAVSFTTAYWQMLVIALIMGLGSGAIDTGLNTFVSQNYRASHMNLLHCFWGVGVTLSPIIMSQFISKGDWQMGYRVLGFIQLGITAVVALSFPLWKKTPVVAVEKTDDGRPPKLTLKAIFKTRGVLLGILTLGAYCAAEFTLGTWGASFLVNARGFSEDGAALAVSAFFGGIMIGRFIAGIAAVKLSDNTLIRIGLILVIPGLILLAVPMGMEGAVAAFMIIGAGMGPVFPSVLHTVPARFGARFAADITGYHMGGAYVAGFAVQFAFGFVAAELGYAFMSYMLIFFIALTFVLNEVTIRVTSKNKAENSG